MAVTSLSKKVLVIDDEEQIVELISDVLTKYSYQPIVATRWTDAMEVIGRGEPDLILLDLKMPTIDGPAMLEFIRKEGIEVPVVVVSGFVTEEVAEELSQLGISGIVRKPFKVTELTAAVQTAIGAANQEEDTPAKTPAETSQASPEISVEDLYSGPVEPALEPGAGTDSSPAMNLEILKAFRRLDGAPETEAPEVDEKVPDSASQVLQALQKNESPPTVSPRASSKPASPSEDALQPPAPPEKPSNELLAPPSRAGEMTHDDLPQDIALQDRHGRSRRRPRKSRPKTLSRRNILFMSLLTALCVAIAGFLALIQWYASRVDLDQIDSKAAQSVSEQMRQDLLKNLRNGK